MTPPPNSPGRPRTLPDEQDVVRFRCSLLAKSRWKRAARAHNQTLSAWIIATLNNNLNK